jgi:uncharacterized protein YifE (UPF0438 family)
MKKIVMGIHLIILTTVLCLMTGCVTTGIKTANNHERMSFKEPGVMTFGKWHRFHIKKYPTAFISKLDVDKTRKLVVDILTKNGYRLGDSDARSINTTEKELNYEERFVAVTRGVRAGYYYLSKEDACYYNNMWLPIVYYGRLSFQIFAFPGSVKVLMYGFIRKDVPFVNKALCNDMPNLNPSIPSQGHPMLWKMRMDIMATNEFRIVHHYKE